MTPGHRNFAFNVTSNSLFGVVVQTTATHRDTAATSSANTLAGLSQADGKERNIGTWGLLHLDTVPLPLFAPVPATTYIHCFRYHSFYFISVLRNVAIKQRLDSTFKLMGALCCGAVADKTPSTLQYPAITPSYPVLIDCVAFCAFLQYHHSDMERAFGNFCSSTHTHTHELNLWSNHM